MAQKLLGLIRAVEGLWPLGRGQNYVNMCKREESGGSGVAHQVMTLVRTQVMTLVKTQMMTQVRTQVRTRVMTQVRTQMRTRVMTQVNTQVTYKANSLGKVKTPIAL